MHGSVCVLPCVLMGLEFCCLKKKLFEMSSYMGLAVYFYFIFFREKS